MELAALRAGRLLLSMAREYLARKVSFGLESTLSGRTYVHLLEEAKAAGYVIELHFLMVPSAEFSIQRVAQRVTKGGHNVPSEDIRRRFERTTENFLRLYVPLADRWSVWDNTSIELNPMASSDETDIDTLIRILKMNPPTTVQERQRSPEAEARLQLALRAWEQAYQDALAENKRWGLPMIPPMKESSTPKAASYK